MNILINKKIIFRPGKYDIPDEFINKDTKPPYTKSSTIFNIKSYTNYTSNVKTHKL
jgi:hypothetical protein